MEHNKLFLFLDWALGLLFLNFVKFDSINCSFNWFKIQLTALIIPFQEALA